MTQMDVYNLFYGEMSDFFRFAIESVGTVNSGGRRTKTDIGTSNVAVERRKKGSFLRAGKKKRRELGLFPTIDVYTIYLNEFGFAHT